MIRIAVLALGMLLCSPALLTADCQGRGHGHGCKNCQNCENCQNCKQHGKKAGPRAGAPRPSGPQTK